MGCLDVYKKLTGMFYQESFIPNAQLILYIKTTSLWAAISINIQWNMYFGKTSHNNFLRFSNKK